MARPLQTLRVRCRMSSNLVHPDRIFTNVPPFPRPWTKPMHAPSFPSPIVSLKWRESKGSHRRGLSGLQTALRSVHKRKVAWPVDESALSALTPGEYLKTLLQPTADLFNQLRSLDEIKKPVECISINFGKFLYGVTFYVEGAFRWDGTPPIILALDIENIINENGKVYPRVEYALSEALQYTPSPTSIIVTNFNEIVVFFPPAWNCPEPIYDRISTEKTILALRVLSTAYLYNVAPQDSLILEPPPMIEADSKLILPEGPPKDFNEPLISDEDLFATHHRHSDFDLATLIRDHDRALQFFRWKNHVQQKYTKVVARPHDTLTGVTNHIGNISVSKDAQPLYPYDPSEIPADTAEHLISVQRESPFVWADSFQKSKTFTLKIQDVIAEGSERGFCTVYKCQLTSIDDEPVPPSSPSLCLKLFDDRFQVLEKPDPLDDPERYESLHRWFDSFVIAELHALNEYFAYEKLRPVQGSVIPWFYGMHQFTLPNGMVLYGLLMEYINGHELIPDFVRSMSADRQIKMIKSCRHAARVLDVADVVQRDWHPGQLLIYTKPQTDIEHAVLIDFAMTTQTWILDEPNLLVNFHGILSVLSSLHGDVGLDWQFVWKHLGEPDDWDPVLFRSRIKDLSNPKSEIMILKTKDMFPYISSA